MMENHNETNHSNKSKSNQAPICKVTFFYVFDMADFFKENSSNFLKLRTDGSLKEIFGYRKKNDVELGEPNSDKLKNIGSFKFNEGVWKEEEEAYLAGWVRLNFLHQFFNPTYLYEKNIVDICNGGVISQKSINEQSDILNPLISLYCNYWLNNNNNNIKDLLDNCKIKLSVSSYGTISVRIEGDIQDVVATSLNGVEFSTAQNKTDAFFNLNRDKGNKNNFKEELRRICGEAICKNGVKIFPSLIDFIALVSAWNFFSQLKDEKN